MPLVIEQQVDSQRRMLIKEELQVRSRSRAGAKAEKLPVSAIYPARRIASTNLGAFIKSAWEYFKDDPLVPIEKWEIPASSDLATHR